MDQDTSSPAITADDATFVEITGKSDWDDFWSANGDVLADDIGDEHACLNLARNGNLLIGGGAAPLFVVLLSADEEVSVHGR